MMEQAEFRNPRLVEVYDAQCRWSREDDFFVSVVSESGASRVLDLGCGTGRLAIGLAAAGFVVTGVDPADASLTAARAKPGADRVTWLRGTSTVLPRSTYDAVLMTSHVAQFFVDDDGWNSTLVDIRRAMVAGGTLAFDTRDPLARGWERWNPAESMHHITLPHGHGVTVWSEVTDVTGSVVSFTHHYAYLDGEELRSTASLRFRGEHELSSSLERAGFTVQAVYGGWNREPHPCAQGEGDGELLVVARA